MEQRVFLQSGDQAVQRSLGEQLLARGFVLADHPEAADLLLYETTPDRATPLCAELRAKGCAQPLLLIGLAAEAARAAGADHGLAKPFRFVDLLRSLDQMAAREIIAIGPFRLDPNARELTDLTGRRLRVTEKEAAVLVFLAKAGGQGVTREALLGEVWGYAGSATTHTVETHIYRLRRKLTDHGGAEILITESGCYRLADFG
jgi:DNA-binding response OmpR family regulator